jgi:HEAT repeat protein
MSILLSKNPDKLLALYDLNDDEETKNKIIDKLKQLKAIPELTEIAKLDNQNRVSLIIYLLKNNLLDENTAENIFSWLNVSKIHSEILNHIKIRFNKKQIIYLLHSKIINPNAKKNLEYIYTLIEKNDKNQVTSDERYLRLKMVYDDADLGKNDSNYDTNNFSEEINLQQIVIKYLKDIKNKDDDEKIIYISETIKEINAKHIIDKNLFFLFVNLANLTLRQIIKLFKYCKNSHFYFPDIFNTLTEFKTIAYEPLHNLFSSTVITKWIEDYFEASYYYDLLFLKINYKEFNQIGQFFKNSELTKYAKSVNIEEKFKIDSGEFELSSKMLTKKFNLSLFDLITDKEILNSLNQCCKNIHKNILANLNNNLYEINKLCKALVVVGGDDNLLFLNSLLNKKPVDDIEKKLKEIELKFLNKKKHTTDSNELKSLIEEEIKQKENLIPSETYHYLLQTIVEYIAMMSNFNEEKKEFLKNNLNFNNIEAESSNNHSLDTLSLFIKNSSQEGKIIACELIRKLELANYIPYLQKFIKEADIRLTLYSAIALKTFDNEQANQIITRLSELNKIGIKKQLASLIHIFKKDLEDELIISLACDTNPSISEEALISISKLPKYLSLYFYEKIIIDIPPKNKSILAKHLGDTENIRAIPLLIEILNNGDFFDYKNVIQALININDPICLNLLQNMDLQKNFTLELEKCRGLIILGDYNGWQELRKFFNINQGNIQFLAKLYFIELANYEQIDILRELTLDTNNKISTLAIAKIMYFAEIEGISLINEVLNNNNYEKIYFVSQLLTLLPFTQITNELKKLATKNHLQCRTIHSIIYAKNGNLNLLKTIEKEILSFDDNQIMDVLDVINDYPIKEAFPILKKMTLLQNTQINHKILTLLKPENEQQITNENTINNFIIELWNKSDLPNKKIIINFICEIKKYCFYEFLKKEFDNSLNQLQVHIARALIMYGDEDYWSFLEQMTMSQENDVKMEAIEAISFIDEKKAYTIIGKLLSTPSESLVIDIIKILSNAHSREIITLLKKFIDSGSSKVKIAVAKTLGSFPYTESKSILEKLKYERDEYLSLACEIALEKIEKNSDFTKIPFYKLINRILSNNNLSINENFITHNHSLLKTQYFGFKIMPLTDFKGKLILDVKHFNQRKQKIEEKLEKQILGNSDVNSILTHKKNAQDKINNIALKEELIVSILNLKPEAPNKEEAQILFDIIKSEDELFIKSFILSTANSKEITFLLFYDKILNLKTNCKYLDLILYAIITKINEKSMKSSQTLKLISKFLGNDKVKYYFIYLINYFSVHLNLLTKEKCDELIQEINQYDIEKSIKQSCIELISTLSSKIKE